MNKTRINILTILTVVFCGLSCTQDQPDSPFELFNCHQIVTLHQVDIPEMLIGLPERMFHIDTMLYFLDSYLPFFKIIDLKKFQLKQFGSKGQGPNEFIMPFLEQHLDDGNILVLDINSVKLFEIDFHKTYITDSLCVTRILRYDRKEGAGHMLKMNNNQYIAIGTFEKGMFAIFDDEGNLLRTIYEYPKHPTHDNVENRIKGMAYQGTLTTNPEKNKIVFAASYAAIIDFFDLKNDSLIKIASYHNTYPQYVPKEQGGGFGVALENNNKTGYVRLYGTEKYVYALYSGRTWEEKGAASVECIDLLVFDWEGHPVKHYILNQALLTFCISSDDKTGYGIGYAPESTLFKFDIIND